MLIRVLIVSVRSHSLSVLSVCWGGGQGGVPVSTCRLGFLPAGRQRV